MRTKATIYLLGILIGCVWAALVAQGISTWTEVADKASDLAIPICVIEALSLALIAQIPTEELPAGKYSREQKALDLAFYAILLIIGIAILAPHLGEPFGVWRRYLSPLWVALLFGGLRYYFFHLKR